MKPFSRAYDRLVTEMHLPGGPLNGSAETLSPRELEILEMAARGLTNDQMAKNLRISVHGVKFHLGTAQNNTCSTVSLYYLAECACSIAQIIEYRLTLLHKACTHH